MALATSWGLWVEFPDGFIRPQRRGTLTRVIRWLLVSISAAQTLFFFAREIIAKWASQT